MNKAQKIRQAKVMMRLGLVVFVLSCAAMLCGHGLDHAWLKVRGAAFFHLSFAWILVFQVVIILTEGRLTSSGPNEDASNQVAVPAKKLTRKDQPRRFWAMVILLIGVSLVMFYGFFYYVSVDPATVPPPTPEQTRQAAMNI